MGANLLTVQKVTAGGVYYCLGGEEGGGYSVIGADHMQEALWHHSREWIFCGEASGNVARGSRCTRCMYVGQVQDSFSSSGQLGVCSVNYHISFPVSYTHLTLPTKA